MPFNLLRPVKLQTVGNRDGWKSPPAPHSTASWPVESC